MNKSDGKLVIPYDIVDIIISYLDIDSSRNFLISSSNIYYDYRYRKHFYIVFIKKVFNYFPSLSKISIVDIIKTIVFSDDEIERMYNMTNKILLTVFSMVADLERDFISGRTKEGLRAREAKGIKLGKPLGTLQNSSYDKDRERIFDLYRMGVPLNKIISIHLKYGKYNSLKDYILKRLPLESNRSAVN